MKHHERYKYTDIQALDAQAATLPLVPAVCLLDNTTLNPDNRIILAMDGQSHTLEIGNPHHGKTEVYIAITCKKNSRNTLFIILTDSPLTQAKIEITLEDNATLSLIEQSKTRGTVSTKYEYTLGRDNTLDIKTLDTDNKLSLRDQVFNLTAAGSQVNVQGIYLCGSGEHIDNFIKMNHLAPHCTSSQLYKGVVGHTAAFTGHILIAKDAQQTVALQENHNILLNDTAKINTRPWLEIYADDVKCNHGATVGKNDPNAIYYMRQRGITEDIAQKILLEGFVTQIIYPKTPAAQKLIESINAKLQTI